MTEPDSTGSQPSPTRADAIDVMYHQAMFTLTPFFIDGAKGDPAKARAAAREMLLSYKAGSAVEIQLAVECIMFAYTVMDSLRQAKVDDMPDARRLRLRNSAVALHRESHRNRQALEAFRKARIAASPARPAQTEPPAEPPAPDPDFDPKANIRNFLRHLTAGGESFPGFPLNRIRRQPRRLRPRS